MNILVTGSKGFIGKNLIEGLRNEEYYNIFEFDKYDSLDKLEEYTKKCDFVFHLAGVNRPKDNKEFIEGNYDFTLKLTKALERNNNKSPIVMPSSTQTSLENDYGKSKRKAELVLFNHKKNNDSKVYVFRLPNVFGKWSRPNYNSVIATFCNNISRDLPITINNPNVILNLVYIDDVVKSFIDIINDKGKRVGEYYEVTPTYKESLDRIASLIKSFKEMRKNLSIPNLSDEFEKKLYSTYLSYLPKDKFKYPLKMNIDNRGSFTEFIRTDSKGQFSVNISRKGITKGNHWHNTKNEKFLVVHGEALIAFRKIGSDEVLKYYVSDKNLEVVDIPTGYTHKIVNIGDEDLVTVMWANEKLDKENPDTYFSEV